MEGGDPGRDRRRGRRPSAAARDVVGLVPAPGRPQDVRRDGRPCSGGGSRARRARRSRCPRGSQRSARSYSTRTDAHDPSIRYAARGLGLEIRRPRAARSRPRAAAQPSSIRPAKTQHGAERRRRRCARSRRRRAAGQPLGIDRRTPIALVEAPVEHVGGGQRREQPSRGRGPPPSIDAGPRTAGELVELAERRAQSTDARRRGRRRAGADGDERRDDGRGRRAAGRPRGSAAGPAAKASAAVVVLVASRRPRPRRPRGARPRRAGSRSAGAVAQRALGTARAPRDATTIAVAAVAPRRGPPRTPRRAGPPARSGGPGTRPSRRPAGPRQLGGPGVQPAALGSGMPVVDRVADQGVAEAEPARACGRAAG